jgi:hemolysin III-related protein
VLAVVWTGALLGVVLQTAWPHAPHWLAVPCYIAVGWVAVFVFPDLLRNGGIPAFVLIAAGGIVYTLGALVYARKRPDPWPGTFGFHEVFHACTLLAALCHYAAIWLLSSMISPVTGSTITSFPSSVVSDTARPFQSGRTSQTVISSDSLLDRGSHGHHGRLVV